MLEENDTIRGRKFSIKLFKWVLLSSAAQFERVTGTLVKQLPREKGRVRPDYLTAVEF